MSALEIPTNRLTTNPSGGGPLWEFAGFWNEMTKFMSIESPVDNHVKPRDLCLIRPGLSDGGLGNGVL
jgi:hypothetical protein